MYVVAAARDRAPVARAVRAIRSGLLLCGFENWAQTAARPWASVLLRITGRRPSGAERSLPFEPGRPTLPGPASSDRGHSLRLEERAGRIRPAVSSPPPIVAAGSAAAIRSLALALVGLASFAIGAAAAIRTVPESHATIQNAVLDASCDEIQLSDPSYAESLLVLRSLRLAGADSGATHIEGGVELRGALAAVQLQDLQIENACSSGSLVVRGGARAVGWAVTVVRGPSLTCPETVLVFADGFESGTSSAWSAAVP